MLKTETEHIGKLFEKTMMRYLNFPVSWMNISNLSFNTICDATQERQRCDVGLVEKSWVDEGGRWGF
jgi:4-hydroxy-3-methylbut-2-enyl diphosphate reductase